MARPLLPRTIAVASHVTEVPGPFHALEAYAKSNFARTLSAAYPFGYTGLRNAVLRKWEGATLEMERNVPASRALSVIRDLMANLVWFATQPKTDVFIGIDNVNALCGILLRSAGKTSSVVYYAIDYTPKRFANTFLNRLYHAVDAFVVRNCDRVWNLSRGMAEIRLQQGREPAGNDVVPIGVDLDIVPPPIAATRPDLVIVSHLVETKGIQVALGAIPKIAESYPDVRLSIIGTGPYESDLKNLAETLGVSDRVMFYGRLEYREMYEVLSRCKIALAPYPDDVHNIARYTDVGKPKEYLACGLPVVITDAPAIAADVASIPMGIVTSYSVDQIASAVCNLLADEQLYMRCRENGRTYMENMTWTAIYDRAFDLLWSR